MDDLARLSPSFSWRRILAAAGLPPVTALNLANPDFVRGLDAVIAASDLDTIKAYLRWQLVQAIPAAALPEALDADRFVFEERALGGALPQQRWMRCLAITTRMLPDAVGQAYVESAGLSTRKQVSQQLLKEIQVAMEARLDAIDWMTSATKQRAKLKLRKMESLIGYPDRWKDYHELAIERGDFYGNLMRAGEYQSRQAIAYLGGAQARTEWLGSTTIENAYYSEHENQIVVPAALLELLPARPTLAPEQYAQLGYVIGHEVTHAFDSSGLQFDELGNFADWWTPEDAKRFEARAACMVTEYSRFVALGDVHIDGQLTLNENIADNGGLRLAFAAFVADAERRHLDLARVQDDYTPVQRFFLGFAQVQCEHALPSAPISSHAPNRVRVNGTAQNMPEFGGAFGCKVEQPMMPADPCRVW